MYTNPSIVSTTLPRVTDKITECINTNTPVSFCKFGDGEYLCMKKVCGANCDGDTYFPELGDKLVEAFQYLCTHPNCFIGRWHEDEITVFLENIVDSNSIPYSHYHSLMNDEEFNRTPDLLNFVKAVQSCNRKKIIISNGNNIKLTQIFNTHHFIEIPERCWFMDYNNIRNRVMENVEDNCIIIAAAGLCSKYLASDLLKNNDTISYLDLGSSFDILCGRNSRGWKHTLSDEIKYYRSVLSPCWS